MRLQTIASSLASPEEAAALIEALDAVGVKTSAHLLFSYTPYELCNRLGGSQFTLQQIIDFREEVAGILAAPGHDGNEHRKEEMDQKSRFPVANIGVSGLDDIVGGLPVGEVVQITGTTGSGKTFIALRIVLEYLCHHPNASVLWIDTDNRFSADRASDILRSMDHDNVNSVLERINVSFNSTATAVVVGLEQLRHSLMADPAHPLRFIVIDTITTICSPLITSSSSQGMAILVALMRQLATLAQIYSFTVLVCNTATLAPSHVSYPKFPTSVDLSYRITSYLGATFGYMTDTIIGVALADSLGSETDGEGSWGWHPANIRAEQEGKRIHVLQILRSRRMGTGKWRAFSIKGGIKLEPFSLTSLE